MRSPLLLKAEATLLLKSLTCENVYSRLVAPHIYEKNIKNDGKERASFQIGKNTNDWRVLSWSGMGEQFCFSPNREK